MQAMRTALLSLWILPLCAAPNTPVDAPKAVQDLAARCEQATKYSFGGELLLEGQRGSAPMKVLTRAKVLVAASRPGKFLLRLIPVGRSAYTLLSNGQKSWVYVPKLKQYTEQDAAALVDAGESGPDQEQDLAEKFARLVMPTLARLASNGESAEVAGWEKVRFEGKKRTWPEIRVKPRQDQGANQSLAELTMDPKSLAVGRLVWTNITYSNDEKLQLRLTVDFSTFKVGGEVPDGTFEFKPSRKAKRVDVVAIPGQTGSFLLNRPAPELELRTIEGTRVNLSDFRGHPVLLSFWASWAGPCRREMPLLVALHEEYKKYGLVILGVNEEGRPVARYFAKQEGLNFATLDDSSLRARRLFRVRSIPAVFLIDQDGKVVRFLTGTQDASALRAALKAVGL